MHAIINSLPDPNYATLRALTLVSMLFAEVISDTMSKMLTSIAFESSTGALCCKQDECWKFGHHFRVRCPTDSLERQPSDVNLRPTLMGTGPNVADAGWQVRVIDTILQNTYQIFDDD